MKLHCLCCGREFETDESDTITLQGRGNGKTIMMIIETIKHRTCSPRCAAHLSRIVYNYFIGVPGDDNSNKSGKIEN